MIKLIKRWLHTNDRSIPILIPTEDDAIDFSYHNPWLSISDECPQD